MALMRALMVARRAEDCPARKFILGAVAELPRTKPAKGERVN
jgi:hypothetical protein